MLSEEMCAFLRHNVDSFESLEVLLLLYRERTAWTAGELCRRFKVRPPTSVIEGRCSLAEERLPGRPHGGAAHEPDQRRKVTAQPLQMLRIDLSQSIDEQSGVGVW